MPLRVHPLLALVLALMLSVLLVPRILAQAGEDFFSKAIQLAQQSQRETTVPASVTLAQAIWETGRGRSPIGAAHNYFGIKAALQADGAVNVGAIAEGWVWAWTKEWDGERYVERRERFRKYRNMEDSFRDHGLLLATAPRYADAMRAVDDPNEFARRVAAAGYATSPSYAADLIRVMERDNLYQYDLARDAAQFLGQSEYLIVKPGEIFQIYFDVKNTGFGVWTSREGYFLASVNEHPFSANPRQELDAPVPPERVKRWALTMIAPPTPGTFRTVWRMQHRGQNFGPEMYIEVEVRVEETGVSLPGGWLIAVGIGLGAALALWRWRRRQSRQKETPPD